MNDQKRFSLVIYAVWHMSGPVVKINFFSHFSGEVWPLCVLSQRLFGHILFPPLQHPSSCAMNVTTSATGSTIGAPALLRPGVTDIPSASTKKERKKKTAYGIRYTVWLDKLLADGLLPFLQVLAFKPSCSFLLSLPPPPTANLSGGNWVWKMVVFFNEAMGGQGWSLSQRDGQ